jgi:hypothetical protein
LNKGGVYISRLLRGWAGESRRDQIADRRECRGSGPAAKAVI